MNEKLQIAVDLCQRFPRQTSLGLARMIYNSYPEWFSNVEAARSMIRSVRGKNGKKNRRHYSKAARVKRKPAVAPPTCPASRSEPWTPFVIERPERTLVLSDIHVPFHDENAVKAAVAWGGSKGTRRRSS